MEVQVVDVNGTACSNMRVTQSWGHYSLYADGNDSSEHRPTDRTGYVEFHERTIRASMPRRIIMPIITRMLTMMHGGGGVSGAVWASGIKDVAWLSYKGGKSLPDRMRVEKCINKGTEQSLAADGAIACPSSELFIRSLNADRALQLKAIVRRNFLIDTMSKGFMKQISLRAMIGIATFALGVALANLMISMRRGSIESKTPATDCAIIYDPTVVQKLRRPDDPWLYEAFQERPLYAMTDCVNEAYSLTWIPSFHPPVVVRVWRSGSEAFIVAKELDSKWRMEFGSIKQTNSRSLTLAEWRDFIRLLNQASYWELPETSDEILPTDGAMWIVEGLSSKQYHWVRRRVPNQKFAEICRHIIKLSGLETAHDLYLQ